MKKLALINTYYTIPVRIGLHLAFWSMFALMFYLVYERYDSDASWAFVTKDMFVLLSIFYPTAYIIIPKWLLKGKYLLSVLWAVLTYLWWASVSYLLCVWVYENYELEGNLKGYVEMVRERGLKAIVTWENIPFYLLDFSYLVSLPIGLKLTQSYIYQRAKKIELERDNLDLELSFLKAQLSPHFLFNSLNNIYRMINKNDPRAADVVLSLAGLMRYNLYGTEERYVPIHKEVEYIDSLLDLQRLRYDERVSIECNVQVDEGDVELAPLILTCFIENAFKHGPEKSQKDAWVRINLKILDGLLTLEVSNSTAPHIRNDDPGGVGIVNTRKRLDLHYENNYSLDINAEERSYLVLLTIDLDKKVEM